MKNLNSHGFTLITLVVTVTIIVILAGAVYAWVDPVARVGQAKDQKRRNDINAFAVALTDYMKDNQGTIPFVAGLTTTTKKVLCSVESSLTCDSDTDTCLAVADTSFYDEYLAELPIAPGKSATIDTGYYLMYSSITNRLIVGSCDYSDTEIVYSPPIVYNSSMYYTAPPAAPSCGGVEYADHCWYYDDIGGQDCDTVCADNGLTCEASVDYGPSDCTLNLLFTADCSMYCGNNLTLPPLKNATLNVCIYNNGTVPCDSFNGSDYSICPCE